MEAATVEVVHAIAGRIRLRVLELPRGTGVVPWAESLGTLPHVVEVRASERTRGVLVLVQGAAEPFLSALEKSGLATLRPLAPRTPMRRIARSIAQIDTRMSEETRGGLSLGAAAFFAFLGASAFQVSRGHFLPAGMTLLKYALEAMEREAERERGAA